MKPNFNNTMLSALDEGLAAIGLARRTGVGAPAMASFAAGAILGGVAALLLAPSSGEELISKLGTRIQALRDTAKRLGVGEITDNTKEKADRPRASNHSKQASAQG